jgi:hypothetical protein
VGFWKDSWIRLKKNRGALISLMIVILLFAVAFVIGPLLSQHSPYAQDLSRRLTGPTSEFWFGTDKFGRDMWTRVWAGTRVSLYIGLLATCLDMFVGVTFGAVSGFVGGRVDDLMVRIVEILNGIPSLVVAILAMTVFRPGIITITIALGITGWTYMALLVRSRMLQLKEQEFADKIGKVAFKPVIREKKQAAVPSPGRGGSKFFPLTTVSDSSSNIIPRQSSIAGTHISAALHKWSQRQRQLVSGAGRYERNSKPSEASATDKPQRGEAQPLRSPVVSWRAICRTSRHVHSGCGSGTPASANKSRR